MHGTTVEIMREYTNTTANGGGDVRNFIYGIIIIKPSVNF
jgi:hypothetical protein